MIGYNQRSKLENLKAEEVGEKNYRDISSDLISEHKF